MARPQRARSVRKKTVIAFPVVHLDRDSDFASIKIAPGVEAKSYQKHGFIFCEDRRGRIIEIQILNLSSFRKKRAA